MANKTGTFAKAAAAIKIAKLQKQIAAAPTPAQKDALAEKLARYLFQ